MCIVTKQSFSFRLQNNTRNENGIISMSSPESHNLSAAVSALTSEGLASFSTAILHKMLNQHPQAPPPSLPSATPPSPPSPPTKGAYKEPGNTDYKVKELRKYWQTWEMKTASGTLRFPNLTNLFKMLTLPHSNADTERVFSIVRRILTEQRSQLEQSTLCALIGCKLNSLHSCFQLETPDNLL